MPPVSWIPAASRRSRNVPHLAAERRTFDVLVSRDLNRLARDAARQAALLVQLKDLGRKPIRPAARPSPRRSTGVRILAMGASDRPPRPPRPPEPPQTNGSAVLEPPPRPPSALSAEQDPPGTDPILVVIYTKDPNLLGRRFVLDRSPVFVGRAVENHIVLHDARVSPRHAHFEVRGAAWWCVDDGSTEGVYVDDQRTTDAAVLAHGTRIGIGSTIFKFLSGKEAEAQYHEHIYRMTICDGLTQVYLKRYLVEALDKEILRARRHDRPLALLMIANR